MSKLNPDQDFDTKAFYHRSSLLGYLSAYSRFLFNYFEQLLYPLKCLKCGQFIDPEIAGENTLEACFCENCMEAGVYVLAPPFCVKCGRKFGKSSEVVSHGSDDNENHICGSCLKNSFKIERVRAVFEYKGILKDAVPLYKYSSKLAAAKPFELLLFQAFMRWFADSGVQIIMPIPLHISKLRKRGFNQAYMMVRNFKKLYKKENGSEPFWEIDVKSFKRIKKTDPQTGFDIEQRKTNLRNAFDVVDEKKIKDKHILLIDDVFTTGSTCNEAAKQLLEKGAERVDALVLARA